MPSERVIKITHVVLFTLLFIASICALGVSAYLVKHFNDNGYPSAHTSAYRDRIRILLVASVWTTAWAIILIAGFLAAGKHRAFGLLTHLVPIVIAFLLFLIGVSSLTALTDKISCGSTVVSKCTTIKGLVAISWIDTIFIFLTLIFLIILCFKARSGYGAHRSTLYLD